MATNRVIKNCIITNEDSTVLTEYNTNEGNTNKVYSIELTGEEIYCPCCGVVIYADKFDDKYGVVVQYSDNVALMFTDLDRLCVDSGDVVVEFTRVGISNKSFKFWYLTSEPNLDNDIINLPLVSYFTHDPNLVLNENVTFESSGKYISDEDLQTIYNTRGYEDYSGE